MTERAIQESAARLLAQLHWNPEKSILIHEHLKNSNEIQSTFPSVQTPEQWLFVQMAPGRTVYDRYDTSTIMLFWCWTAARQALETTKNEHECELFHEKL